MVITTKTSKTVLINKSESTNENSTLTIRKLQPQPQPQQQKQEKQQNEKEKEKITKQQQHKQHKTLFDLITFIIYYTIFYIAVGIRSLYKYYLITVLKIKSWVFQLLLSFQVKSPNDYVDYIKSRIEKDCIVTPRHMAIILNHHDQVQSTLNQEENTVFYNKLSEILIWSIIIGVNRVTIFDNHGSLKKNISFLQDLLIKRTEPFNHNNNNNNSNNLTTRKYIFNWLNSNSSSNNNNNKYINNKSNSLLDISIVTIEDGKQELINITKKYVREQLEQKQQQIQQNTIQQQQQQITQNINILNESYINQNLSKPIGGALFEPEAALDFTGQYFFAGFLPWHIKLTEFIKIDYFHQFYFERYMHFLRIYSGVQKRCGK